MYTLLSLSNTRELPENHWKKQRNETILKIGHLGKAIALAKLSAWVKK